MIVQAVDLIYFASESSKVITLSELIKIFSAPFRIMDEESTALYNDDKIQSRDFLLSA